MSNRKIDTIVAEKVMGWTEIKKGSFADFDYVGKRPLIDDTYSQDNFLIPHYSTDPAAAMQVLEETERRLGCEISMQIHSGRHGMDRVWNGKQWQRKRYAVTISLGTIAYDSPNCSFTVYGDSLGAAACETALKAVENAVSDDELELSER